MIAFDFNIHFQDEPSLDDQTYDKTRKVLRVVEDQSLDKLTFDHESDHVLLSGRKVKYYSILRGKDRSAVWAVEIENVLLFLWHDNPDLLSYKKLPKYTPKLLEFWSLHTVLPLMFSTLRLYDILHVGAVEIEGVGTVFSAPSFGGKSTLVDFFLQKGHALIADDTIGVLEQKEKYYMVPSYPYHRPFRLVESLGQKVKKVNNRVTEFHHLYRLKKVDPHMDVSINELHGIQKFNVLHFSTFVNFDSLQVKNFDLVTGLARSLRVYEVTLPWDMGRLEEVYSAITAHVISLKDGN